jgi:hypothetical protein
MLLANLLIVLSVLLIVFIGAPLQKWSLGWGLLLSELLLVLLPALLFTLLGRRPRRAALRLRWPGWRLTLLGLLIGGGMWLFSVAVGLIANQLFGYTPPNPAGLPPTTLGQAVLLFVAMALSAPLCEEIFWRGYVQSAYERLPRPWVGALFTSLLFIVWHLRFQGFLALVPIAVAVGLLGWRSQSIFPAILAHFAYNAISSIISTLVGLAPHLLNPANTTAMLVIGLGAICLVAISLPLLVISWVLFWRWTKPAALAVEPPPSPASAPAAQTSTLHPPLSTFIPLLLILPVFIYFAVYEVLLGRFPQVLAQRPLPASSAPWSKYATWTYELRNVAGETFGQRNCALGPEIDAYSLYCREHREAYAIDQGSSHYYGGELDRVVTYQWSKDLRLHQVAMVLTPAEGLRQEVNVGPNADLLLVVSTNLGSTTLPISDTDILPDEWPWRLAGLPFDQLEYGGLTFALPEVWDAAAQTSQPARRGALLVILGKAPLQTPLGQFEAWQVQLQRLDTHAVYTAWYTVNTPRLVLKYTANSETGVLTAIGP